LTGRPALPPGGAAPVSAGLIRDRDSVRQLSDKLYGVEIYEDANQCVPMLTMVVGLGWEAALDEYALGAEEKVSIRELEALFEDRWRKVGDRARARRQGKLYSARPGIYWAFATEYAKRGAVVCVAQIVFEIKSMYSGRSGAVGVVKLARTDYPRPP